MSKKTNLLKQLSRKLSGEKVDFSAIDQEVAALKKKLEETVNIQTVEDVSRKLKQFQSKIDFGPLLTEIQNVRVTVGDQVKQLEASILSKNQARIDASHQGNIKQLNVLSIEIDNLKKELGTIQAASLSQLSSLTTQLTEIKNVEQSTKETISTITASLVGLSTKKETDQALRDIQDVIDTLRADTLKRMSSIGGGSMNQKISVNGTVMSTKYADFNFVGSVTAANNNTTKQVDITFAGSTPSIGGTITGGTTGSVLFVGAGATFAQDNANFFWDDTNNRLGLGTAIPLAPLETVDSSSATVRGAIFGQYSSDTSSSRILLRKARNTLASPQTIVTGDALSSIMAEGYDGTAYLQMGRILFTSEGTIGTGQIPTNLGFYTATNASPSVLTEALRIDSSQNIIVGSGELTATIVGGTIRTPNPTAGTNTTVAGATLTLAGSSANANGSGTSGVGGGVAINLGSAARGSGGGNAAAGDLVVTAAQGIGGSNTTNGRPSDFTFTGATNAVFSLNGQIPRGSQFSFTGGNGTQNSNSGSAAVAGPGGGFLATTGNGGNNSGSNAANTQTAGFGGPLTLTLGNGGNAVTSTGTKIGGAAGIYSLVGGTGGAATSSTTTVTVTGGKGSDIIQTTGTGGAATGAGGTSTAISGNGGDFTWNTGPAGVASGGNTNTQGSIGNHIWQTNGTERLRIIGSSGLLAFGGVTSSFPAIKRSSAIIALRLADDSADASFSAAGVALSGKITTYNNIATAGWGSPAIYGSGRSAAQTAAVASVAAYTVGASDGSFMISANVNVTTSTDHSFTVTCAYTDETNTARTLTLSFIQIGGGTPIATITNVTGAGPYEGVPNHIRCKSGTTITVATTGTFTTVTYNVEGIITQIA